MGKTEAFLAQIYDFDAVQDRQGATWLVYDQIDQSLLQGDFEGVDDILTHADTSRLSSFSLRSLLTITFEARDKLESRARFYDLCFARMKELRGDEATLRLLGRLGG